LTGHMRDELAIERGKRTFHLNERVPQWL